MAEINDFGFTAVDQDELKTKTGEDASIGKEVADQLKAVAASSAGQANSAQIEDLDTKVDLLTTLISNSLELISTTSIIESLFVISFSLL